MKNTLFILSIVFVSHSAFSTNNNHVDYNRLKAEVTRHCANNLPVAADINLGDGYTISGTIIQTGSYTYLYSGVLYSGGNEMGDISIAFEVSNDGLGTIIETSIVEDYSNLDTESVAKTRHDTLLHCVRNMRCGKN